MEVSSCWFQWWKRFGKRTPYGFEMTKQGKGQRAINSKWAQYDMSFALFPFRTRSECTRAYVGFLDDLTGGFEIRESQVFH